jgi:mannosyl-oligosaccharide alpha-1,2-mannosidase
LGNASVFETNIRFVGGFLSVFAMTSDELFKNKAKYVADKLLPAFNTSTGLPKNIITIITGETYSGNFVDLTEFGTLHLEFIYLSEITNDPIYKSLVMNIRKLMKDLQKPKGGLYPIHVNLETGQFFSSKFNS